MEGPQPPRDASLRNIIDKLAEFVARNGPEFEMITKQKQQNNPKFEFLYGGEFAGYYQYRVATEQSYLKQQSGHTQNINVPIHNQKPLPTHFTQGPPPVIQQVSTNIHENSYLNQPPPNHLWSNLNTSTQQSANGNTIALNLQTEIEAINAQQSTLRDQIRQSESNLTAQHSALMAQQNKQIEDAIEAAQNTQLEKQAEENGISLQEFDGILQPIIESCTKDSISSGKNWILQHSSDNAKNNVVLQYLLKKALLNGSTFQQKLHLIYLINDILHHCVRKNANDLKNCLENVVIPMFCSADLIASSDQRAKLTKLLSLWESKAKFFDACVISKLQSPDSSMKEYKTNLQNLYHDSISKYTQTTKSTLDNYQKQHKIFIQHATQQITQLEQQKLQLEQQMLSSVLPNSTVLPNTSVLPPSTTQHPPHHAHLHQQSQQQIPSNIIPSLMSQKIVMPDIIDADHMIPPGVDDNSFVPNNNMFSHTPHQHQHLFNANNCFPPQQLPQNSSQTSAQTMQKCNFSSESMQQAPPNFFIPDLSKPPPGFLGGGTGSISTQLPSHMQLHQQQQQQQQYPNLSNIPPTSENVNSVPNDNSMSTSNMNIDIMTLNAALQIVQHQQQQQQQQQQLQHQQPSAEQIKSNDKHEFSGNENIMLPHITAEDGERSNVPYYDLPAGLMVPLIRLEDYNYKPLDSTDIRIPTPQPTTERLLNAMTAFYAPPTHDRPRDTEGWEKLGLYEYYKVKNAARKLKEEELKSGKREKSRSPSPIPVDKPKPKNLNKRSYRSKSRSRSRSLSRSRSPPPSRSREREKDKEREKDRERDRDRDKERDKESRQGNRSNRYNRTRSPRRSPPPRERSNSTRREREKSLTPPSFDNSSSIKTNEFIEESNKGHQMLMKMGWAGTGSGLGTNNQGIDQPISAGEVRDRKDLYKGLGVNLNDPFENFRKNKGAAFVHRMRTRDDKS